MRRVLAGAAAIVGGALLVAGRSFSRSSLSPPAGGSSPASSAAASSGGASSAAAAPVTVRLGYLANITHAPALIGVKDGYFTKALGSAGTLKTTTFTSGTQETT